VKASAFRRWPVTFGLIALVQTTRWTGGHDWQNILLKLIKKKFLNTYQGIKVQAIYMVCYQYL